MKKTGKPDSIVTIIFVILFFIVIIGGFIWSISGSSEIAIHSRYELKRGLIIVCGLIIFISIMVGIGTVIKAIIEHFGYFIDWLKYNNLKHNIRNWFKDKFKRMR